MLFSSVSWLNIIFLTSLFILTIFRCIILHKWYNSFFFFFMATDWYASNLILWSLNVNNLKKHMFWSRELLIKMQLVQTEFTREFKKKRFFSYNELKTNYFLKFWNVFEKEGRSQDEDITICQVKSAKVTRSQHNFSWVLYSFSWWGWKLEFSFRLCWRCVLAQRTESEGRFIL